MSTVKDCLGSKPQRVIQVKSTDCIRIALELMKEHKVRAVLVIDNDHLVGIISQGDCAIRAFLAGRDANTTAVSEVMTPNPQTVKLGDPMELCMGLMANRGFRHLPVTANDRIVGVVSIGDVVKAVISEKQFLIEQLENYISSGG